MLSDQGLIVLVVDLGQASAELLVVCPASPHRLMDRTAGGALPLSLLLQLDLAQHGHTLHEGQGLVNSLIFRSPVPPTGESLRPLVGELGALSELLQPPLSRR